MEKKDFEAGLFDDRISVLELAKSRSKKQSKNETKKLQLDSTLDQKTVESFKGSYKLNCDQLLDMQRTKS